MSSSVVLRTLVLREAIRLCGCQDYSSTPEVLRYLKSNETRNCVYDSCVELVKEDPQRCGNIAHFVLCYLPSFPPSQHTLRRLQSLLANLSSEQRAENNDATTALCELLHRYIAPVKLHLLSSRTTAPRCTDRNKAQFVPIVLAANISKNQAPVDHIISTQGVYCDKRFQPLNVDESKRCLTQECTTGPVFACLNYSVTAAERGRNANHGCLQASSHSRIQFIDYMQHFSLPHDETAMREHLHTLGQFCDSYGTSRAVVQATLFLVELVCDGYVSKLPLCCNSFAPLRSVTLSLLPTLLEWMESDYLCVRNHVYDFIATLALHLQMVDSQDMWRGCTQALQAELSWIMRSVLHRQCLTRVSDETTWSTAAKCTLGVLPSRYLPLVDVHVLLYFTRLAGLAELHPSTFTLLVESIVSALMVDKRLNAASERGVVLDEAAVMEFEAASGGHSMEAEILKLYRRATMRGARRALFRLLFACAARQVKQTEEKNRRRAGAGAACAKSYELSALHCGVEALISLGLDWHMYTVLFTLTPHEVRALTGSVMRSTLGFRIALGRRHEWRGLTTKVVHTMLSMIADDLATTSMVTQCKNADRMDAMRCTSVARIGTLTCPQDCTATDKLLQVLPVLLREERLDDSAYHVAWLLAYHGILHAARALPVKKCVRFVESLARCLAHFGGAGNARTRSRVRRVCVDLVTSLLLDSCTVYSLIHARSCAVLLEYFLSSVHALFDVGNVMTLYYRLIELLVVEQQRPRLFMPLLIYGDVTDIFPTRGAPLSATRAASLGVRTWWMLYRALGCNQTSAVCCARHVILIAICSLFVTVRGLVPSYTWQMIGKEESYVPNACFAATQVAATDCILSPESCRR